MTSHLPFHFDLGISKEAKMYLRAKTLLYFLEPESEGEVAQLGLFAFWTLAFPARDGKSLNVPSSWMCAEPSLVPLSLNIARVTTSLGSEGSLDDLWD